MKELKLRFLLVCLLVVLLGAAPVALGDWDRGDPYKMHYPQLPDLNDTGLDVLAGPLSVVINPTPPDDIHEKFLADDFLCTSTGLITDIHIWASYNGDIRFTETPWFSLVIYENIPAGTGGIPWSRPGRPLWDAYLKPTAERVYATDVLEGFYDPNPDEIIGSDTQVWQFNFKIDPCDAFEQEEGKIYWLGLHHSFDLDADGDVDVADVFELIRYWPAGPFGWKTSGVEQYEDDAVWTEVFTWATDPHVVPDSTAAWLPLDYPTGHPDQGRSFDLAFVINSVEDPKHKRLKWSQPPIEADPTMDIPAYCGWDEWSYRSWVDPTWYPEWNCKTQCHADADCDGDVDADDEAIFLAAWPPNPYDARADFNRDFLIDADDQNILASNMGTNPDANCAGRPQNWDAVADDYRCLGHMPVDSVHWWGSYYMWDTPEEWPPPFDLPVAWRIGFWSNASCNELYGAAAPPGSGGSPSSLYKIDPSTGAAALIGPIGFNGVTGLSFGPDGTLYASANGDALTPPPDANFYSILLTIDTTTGAGTLVGEIGNSANPTGAGRMPDISFAPNGKLFGSGDRVGGAYNHALYTIDTITGAGTFVGYTGFGNAMGTGMDFAPDGKLYSTPTDGLNNCLARLNPFTGAGVCVPGTQGNVPDRINALEFCDYSGVLYGSWLDWSGFIAKNYLVTIDLKTGLPKIVGPTVTGLTALAFAPSRPDKLVHQFQVPADRVDMNEVGYDEYFGWYPYDNCYQYYLELEPDEVFWQGQFLDDTMGNIFWLSIAAVYDPDLDEITNPWGWKTRPWPWMDDAMRFWLAENPEPNLVLDPCNMEPIVDPQFEQSFDVAFELDTRRDYIKWDEPFTGIREWPHYEDEQSVAYELTFVEYGSKYIQHPDLSPNGIDVDATVDVAGTDPMWGPQRIGDDFNCTTTGPITDIHIWGSWYHDIVPNGDPYQVDFTLYIYTDNPVGPNGWSEPNEPRWSQDFLAGNFDVSVYAVDVNEGYYVPCEDPPYYEREADDICYLYSFYIDPVHAFYQKGDPCHPVTYWLVVEARPHYDPDLIDQARFGWKTSKEHWKDDGVWTDDFVWWEELTYPLGHPDEGDSIDLAFEITTGRMYTDLWVKRQVADDWPCEHNEPVTDAAWWGSYMGYKYAACQEPQPLPPPRPKYFWLTIWDDVPAGHFNNEYPYSHPNDTWMWEYKAYDWDEVLVGYDKYPEDPGTDPGREAVFRYSVDLPEEAWFYQEEPNSIYWFSVVAVYDPPVPDPNWGWTNHEHVYKDDAVAGYQDAAGGWTWEELYDQTEVNSVDMSFTLFAEECLAPGKTAGGVYITLAMYNLWVSLGRPECWCYDCHSRGDSDGDCDVDTADISTLLAGWSNYPSGACADTDNDGDVDTADISNLLYGWNNGCPPGCVPLP